jgi:hypothetical protein
MAGGRAAGGSSSAEEGTAVVLLVIIVLLLLNVGAGGYILMQRNSSQSLLAEERRLAAIVDAELKTTKVEYDELNTSLETMRRLIELAERLDPPDRVLWSRKLNALPMLTPTGVFLTQIEVTQRIQEVDTPESTEAYNRWLQNRRGPQPVIEKVPVVTQQLVMRGISYVESGTATQRLEQYEQFVRNLRSRQVRLPFDQEPSSFMEGLVDLIQLSPYDQTTMQGRDVGTFTVTLTTKPVTIR